MKKRLALLLALLMTLSLVSCSSAKKQVERELGISLADGKVVETSDTHGGFLGDGLLLTKVEFSACPDEIIKTWKALPDETVTSAVRDVMEEITAFFPDIGDGYCFFHDYNDDDEKAFAERGYYNFTVAIYDTATNLLYFANLDT